MPGTGHARIWMASLVVTLAVATARPAFADEAKVAVAANFTEAAKEIVKAFHEKAGDEVVLSFGSTGQLYNQIAQGAPFEVFLAADTERPARAIEEGYGVDGSNFAYAIGQIVLWSKDASLVEGEATLKNGTFDKIAIANPAAAPYGTAAVQAMKGLGVYDELEPKIVQGNNIAQAFQFVDTGNAAIGFVALSQIAMKDEGSRWVVPSNLYEPIRQDAVLLKPGEKNEAAKAFLEFLKGAEAGRIIEKYGYAVGGNG